MNLFLTILAEHSFSIDNVAVAAKLGCSARAVQERLKKLHKRAAEEGTVGTTTGTTPPPKKKVKGGKSTAKTSVEQTARSDPEKGKETGKGEWK